MRVLVSVGETVSRGDDIAIVEAMKMEHRVGAPRDGVVETVTVAAEQQVEAGQVLATLEKDNE